MCAVSIAAITITKMAEANIISTKVEAAKCRLARKGLLSCKFLFMRGSCQLIGSVDGSRLSGAMIVQIVLV